MLSHLGQQASPTEDLSIPRIAGFDRQIAVVIGIDAYGHGVHRLTNARGDATRVAEVLSTRQGYEPHVLLDAAADLASLCRFFEQELPLLVTAQSQLLVYFAGHGVAHEDKTGRLDGFLLPSDAHASGRNWLPMQSVRRGLVALPCHHLLLVLDCCFAGVFAKARYRDIELAQQPMYQEQYEYRLRRRAYYLLASAAHDERALDRLAHKQLADATGDEQGSPFARAFVAGISAPDTADRNNDGVATISELYEYIRYTLATEDRLSQTPSLWPLDWHDAGPARTHRAHARLG